MAYDKAVDSAALDSALTGIADAIRGKTGENGKLTLDSMPDAIRGIRTADTSNEDGIVQRTISGEYSNDRVTQIGAYAFRDCGGLTGISFPKVVSIGTQAFRSCGLTAVNFPLVTVLGTFAFSNCTSLTSVDFPLVTVLGNQTFSDCTSLTSVVLRASTVCNLQSANVFTGTPIESGTGYVYVPDELVDSYKSATNWSVYADQIRPISELEEKVWL